MLAEDGDEYAVGFLAFDDEIEACTIRLRADVLGTDNAASVTNRNHASAGAGAEIFVEIASGGGEQHAILRKITSKCAFFLRDGLTRSEELNVCRADVGDDAVFWA